MRKEFILKEFEYLQYKDNTKDNFIMGSKIYERSGVRVSYAISSREENKAVASSLFSFQEKDYKGYEYLDMR